MTSGESIPDPAVGHKPGSLRNKKTGRLKPICQWSTLRHSKKVKQLANYYIKGGGEKDGLEQRLALNGLFPVRTCGDHHERSFNKLAQSRDIIFGIFR